MLVFYLGFSYITIVIKIPYMKSENDILIQICILELQLSQALKQVNPNQAYILHIQTEIDTLNWVLEK